MKEAVRCTKINNGISSRAACILISILAIKGVPCKFHISAEVLVKSHFSLKDFVNEAVPWRLTASGEGLNGHQRPVAVREMAGVWSLNALCPALLCRSRHLFYLFFKNHFTLRYSLSTVNCVFKVRSWISLDVWIQRWNLLCGQDHKHVYYCP